MRTIQGLFLRVLLGLLLLAGLVWGVDTLSVQFNFPTRELYAVIRVDQLYAIPNKWNEVDWSRGDPVMEKCVNSLLPHGGMRACWVVRGDTMHVNRI